MSVASRLARNPIAWAVLLVLVVLGCASCLTIVSETEEALVVRLGQPVRVVNAWRRGQPFGGDGAGLLGHWPLIEQVFVVDKRVHDVNMERQPVLSTDQLRLEVDAFARYRIVNPLQMYLSAHGDERRVAEALKPILGSALRNELGRRPFAALLTPERDRAMEAIRDAMNRVARQYGARILDVRINRAELPDGTPLDSAFERMRTARKQQALTILAEGNKQAQIIRADANAEASRIYADAFGKDPDFYDFYRSMQSYRATFGADAETPGSTTMILSPDSAYLRNFQGRRAK